MLGPEEWESGIRADDYHYRGEHNWTMVCDIKPKCRDVDPNHTDGDAVAEPDESPRGSALLEARDLITGDRNNQYGPPTQDFARTADLLNALGYRRVDAGDVVHDIAASDVALIIAQVKVSRIIHTRHKRDSWVDLAGYAACGYECAVEEAEG
jgi:hypothetical protein